MTMIQVEDPQPNLIAAIESGQVEGDVYRDGEVYVDTRSWYAWCKAQGLPLEDPPLA